VFYINDTKAFLKKGKASKVQWDQNKFNPDISIVYT
jgi:hypothetical protein